ncbi:MAG TPA: hypothetical protein EYG20_10070 [Alcanivorax sp.]|nr:hypothetical protein [Alcanivorax sp.]
MKTGSQAPEFTPSVIRGESTSDLPPVIVDTVSFSFPLSLIGHDRSNDDSLRWTASDEEIVEAFQLFMDDVFGRNVFTVDEKVRAGRNFFDAGCTFDGVFIAFGGNNRVPDGYGGHRIVEQRFQLYVDGDGCCRVPDWSRVHKKISQVSMDCRITRADLAYDDHAGSRDVAHAIQLYKDGAFTGRGRPPKASYVDDFDSGKGKTLYIGNRANGKILRVYEKGRQLGDVASAWVRWELELHNRDREIPFDVLVSPQEFLAGSYPAMSWVSDIIQKISTGREKLKITYQKLVASARIQYGKLLHFGALQLGKSKEEMFHEIYKSGVPERLRWAADNHLLQRELGEEPCFF